MQNPEIYRSRDQIEADVWEFLLENASLLSEHGTVVQSWRGPNHQNGPYFRLDYTGDDGRRRAVYLGADCELAAQVRQRLAELQRPDKERRVLARARRVAKWELRKAMQGLEREMAALGLALHGSEIRGWQSSSVFKKTAAGQTGGRHDD